MGFVTESIYFTDKIKILNYKHFREKHALIKTIVLKTAHEQWF